MQYLLLLDNEVARDSYLNWLADQLKISEETLSIELHKAEKNARHSPLIEHRTVSPAKSAAAPQGKLPQSMTDPKLKIVMTELLRNILHHRECAEKTARELPPDYLDDGPVAQAVTILVQAFLNDEWEQGPARITRTLAASPLDCSEVFTLLTEECPASEGTEIPLRIVDDCLRSIRRKYLQNQIAGIQTALLHLPPGEERQSLLKEFMNLTRQLAGNPPTAEPEEALQS